MTPSIINGAFDFTEELGKMSDMSQDGGEELIHEESRPKHELCCQKLDQFATKNVIIISVCFLLLFTAFNGLQYLQSSIHTAEGLGLATISILYAVLAASNLFSLAPAVISKVGHKWTMVVSMGAYLFWVLMNGHATWFTMVPAAVLVGLAAGPLWVSQSAYLTITATSVANQSGESMGAITHRYFGVFAFLFSLCKSSQIAKLIGSTSNRHRSDTKILERCLVDVDPWLFPVYESALSHVKIKLNYMKAAKVKKVEHFLSTLYLSFIRTFLNKLSYLS